MSDDPNHPFSDPSVKAAVESSSTPARNNPDEYNPFQVSPQSSTPSNIPVLPQSTIIPSPLTSNARAQVRQHISNLEQTRIAIEESDLSGSMYVPMSDEARQGGAGSPRIHNFPPIPSFCPCKPCFHQDIHADIPVAFQKWTLYAFYVWLLLQAALLLNVIAAFASALSTSSRVLTFIVSIVWVLTLSPISYMGWFRPLYKAFRDDSSLNFMIFFFVFFIHIVFSVLMIIGSVPTGFCGLVVAIDMFSSKSGGWSVIAGLLCTVVTFLITAHTITAVILLIQVHRLYRSTGASLARAQQEFTSNVRSNRQVQQAAATFVTQSFASPAAVNSNRA